MIHSREPGSPSAPTASSIHAILNPSPLTCTHTNCTRASLVSCLSEREEGYFLLTWLRNGFFVILLCEPRYGVVILECLATESCWLVVHIGQEMIETPGRRAKKGFAFVLAHATLTARMGGLGPLQARLKPWRVTGQQGYKRQAQATVFNGKFNVNPSTTTFEAHDHVAWSTNMASATLMLGVREAPLGTAESNSAFRQVSIASSSHLVAAQGTPIEQLIIHYPRHAETGVNEISSQIVTGHKSTS